MVGPLDKVLGVGKHMPKVIPGLPGNTEGVKHIETQSPVNIPHPTVWCQGVREQSGIAGGL